MTAEGWKASKTFFYSDVSVALYLLMRHDFFDWRFNDIARSTLKTKQKWMMDEKT